MRVRIDQSWDQDHWQNITGVRRQRTDRCNTTVLLDDLHVLERRLIRVE